MLLVLSSNLSTFAWDALEDQRILKLVARDLPLCWSNTDEELKSIVIYLIIYNQTRQMPPPGFSGQNLIYYNTQWNDSCHQSSSQRIKLALRLQVVAKARARWKHYILSWTLLSGCSWKLMWGLRNAVSPASGSGCEQPRVPQLSPGWHTEHVRVRALPSAPSDHSPADTAQPGHGPSNAAFGHHLSEHQRTEHSFAAPSHLCLVLPNYP